MSGRRGQLDVNVFEAALDRLIPLYEGGHRVVVSFSAGKDSGICLELCIMAAELTGRLPVEVVMRDEEIMFPGTFEYAERVAARPEVDFHWLIANQPILNLYDRRSPYFWVFDPELPPEAWVRQPPPYARVIQEQNILAMLSVKSFPPPDGKMLVDVTGLRTRESSKRAMAIASSGGYLTRHPQPESGVYKARPIYDWQDGDVWLAIQRNGWDYNRAYDVMHKLGISRNLLRIAPPTMNGAGLTALSLASKAWPQWFQKVAERCPGVRSAVMFGQRAITPTRRLGETWQTTFWRECVEEAPDWISRRSRTVALALTKRHARHSSTPFPEINSCLSCGGGWASWKRMSWAMWNGDPFSSKYPFLPYVEPVFFRPSLEGTDRALWGGRPTW